MRIELNNEQSREYYKQHELVIELNKQVEELNPKMQYVGSEYTKKLCKYEAANGKINELKMVIIFAKNDYAKFFNVKSCKDYKDTLKNTEYKIRYIDELLENVKKMCAESSKQFTATKTEDAKNIMRECSRVKLMLEDALVFLMDAKKFATELKLLRTQKNKLKHTIWRTRLEFKKSLGIEENK
jgi:hypothetical protein